MQEKHDLMFCLVICLRNSHPRLYFTILLLRYFENIWSICGHTCILSRNTFTIKEYHRNKIWFDPECCFLFWKMFSFLFEKTPAKRFQMMLSVIFLSTYSLNQTTNFYRNNNRIFISGSIKKQSLLFKLKTVLNCNSYKSIIKNIKFFIIKMI